jgi:hypothetical protein
MANTAIYFCLHWWAGLRFTTSVPWLFWRTHSAILKLPWNLGSIHLRQLLHGEIHRPSFSSYRYTRKHGSSSQSRHRNSLGHLSAFCALKARPVLRRRDRSDSSVQVQELLRRINSSLPAPKPTITTICTDLCMYTQKIEATQTKQQPRDNNFLAVCAHLCLYLHDW